MSNIVVQRAQGDGEVGTLQKRETYICACENENWIGSITVNKQVMIDDRIANGCDE